MQADKLRSALMQFLVVDMMGPKFEEDFKRAVSYAVKMIREVYGEEYYQGTIAQGWAFYERDTRRFVDEVPMPEGHEDFRTPGAEDLPLPKGAKWTKREKKE